MTEDMQKVGVTEEDAGLFCDIMFALFNSVTCGFISGVSYYHV